MYAHVICAVCVYARVYTDSQRQRQTNGHTATKGNSPVEIQEKNYSRSSQVKKKKAKQSQKPTSPKPTAVVWLNQIQPYQTKASQSKPNEAEAAAQTTARSDQEPTRHYTINTLRATYDP